MSRRLTNLLVVVLWFSTVSLTVRAVEPIVPEDAKLEKLFEGIVLTEGVSVAPNGMVYFSDMTFSHQAVMDDGSIHAGHIWIFNPTTMKTKIFRSPSGMSNGIKFDAMICTFPSRH